MAVINDYYDAIQGKDYDTAYRYWVNEGAGSKQTLQGFRRGFSAYYAGIICERRASAPIERGFSCTGPVPYDWLRQALKWYEKADAIRPPANDDPLRRWNICARAIMKHRTCGPHQRSPHRSSWSSWRH